MSLSAQTAGSLTGTVLDSTSKAPLSHALVYLTPDTATNFLAFGYTDAAGFFELSMAANQAPLRLHVRFLGYQGKTLAIQPGAALSLGVIVLQPEKNELQQVVVRQKRPPITQQMDTIVYDVKAFTDSTEYSVEDILRKLPGIAVSEDGQITVQGKAIQTVLVEDTDMFGRKYTMGTKNVRAEFIDKVEIIYHYQENPVLRNVNLSDDIVLNLRLKEDKKNILNGIANVGLGLGADQTPKGLLNTNIFSIAKRQKLMLLSSNDNTGLSSGFDEVVSTYDNLESRGVRKPLHQLPNFLQLSAIDNPGLPREFIDPTTHLFSTLRSHQKLSANWDMAVNAAVYQQKGSQQSASRQSFFLEEATYNLAIDRQLQLACKNFLGDAMLTYISPDKKRSFYTYLEINRSTKTNKEQLTEEQGGNFQQYDWRQSERLRAISLGSLWSQQIGERGVWQAQLKAANYFRPQTLLAQNNDLPFVFGLDSSWVHLSQALDWQHRALEATGRYLWSKGIWLLEIAPSTTYTRSVLENELGIGDSPQSTTESLLAADFFSQSGHEEPRPAPFPAQGQSDIQMRRTSLQLNLQTQLPWVRLQLSSELSDLQAHIRANDEKIEQQIASLRLGFHRDFTAERSAKLQYTYQQNDLLPQELLFTPFFLDAYSLRLPLLQDRGNQGHSLRFNYNVRNTFELRSWYVQLGYNFGQLRWRSNQFFARSLLLSVPFLPEANNSDLFVNGHWDQFVSRIKTNVNLQAAYQYAQSVFALADQPLLLNNNTFRLGAKINYTALYPFKFLIEGRWQRSFTRQPAAPEGVSNTIDLWRTAFTTLYLFKGWQASVSWNASFSNSSNGSIGRLQGFSARCRKEIELRQRPITLGLRIINFPNLEEYSTWASDAYFTFRSSTRAVPAFAIFEVDFSF